ncbi:kinesin motor domain-containing protein [Sporodiniella umbellata]|nr:kinesin motor domain-containing protein [Sporodiniella umbellata]
MNQSKRHHSLGYNKDPKKLTISARKIATKAKGASNLPLAKSKAITNFPKSSKRSSLSPQTENNIEVILRCKGKHNLKPVLPNVTRPSVIAPEIGNEETDIRLNEKNTTYKFDHVFYQECSQQRLYDRVGKPIIHEVLNGYNCTIFAYGQTGTGKTYTMEGELSDTDDKPVINSGIIPRIIYDLFQNLKRKEDTVKISMLELYNEELRDLLRQNEDSKPLNIFEDSASGVKVQNAHEVLITNASQGLDIMRSGVKKRMTAATKCNEKSSRSHCIYTLTITFQKKNENGVLVFCTSKLNLVDLAGSENSKASGSEHLRAKEASSINKSLLTLGRVIKSLAEKALHIPYRESKLTRLLKDSLGGRTKTAIITTVDPLIQSVEEIKNTLEYSSHAKSISNIPQKNTTVLYQKQMDEVINDYLKLQEELHRSWNKNGHCLSNDEYDEWLTKFETTQQRLVERDEENVLLREENYASREEAKKREDAAKKCEEAILKLKEEGKKKDEETAAMKKELIAMRREAMLAKDEAKKKDAKLLELSNRNEAIEEENNQYRKEIKNLRTDFNHISEFATKRGVKRERENDMLEDRSRKK